MVVLQEGIDGSKMTSTETQATVFDEEGALAHLKDVYQQYLDLSRTYTQLEETVQSRDHIMDQSLKRCHKLDGLMDELTTNVKCLNGAVAQNQASIDGLEAEYDLLDDEKEKMEEETHELRGQEVKITIHDVENEHRVTEYVREELFLRMKDLSSIQKRMSEMTEEYSKEWEGYKSDMESYSNQSKAMQDDLDHVHEIALARYLGLQHHKGVDASEKDLAQRIIDHHKLEVEHRSLHNDVTESDIQTKDIENEISDLVNEKRLLWKRCIDLEANLDKTEGGPERLTLRPATAHANLHHFAHLDNPPTVAASNEMITPSAVEFVTNGRMLHRCHKDTFLSVDEGSENDIEFQKLDGRKNEQEDSLPPPEQEADQGKDTDGGISKTEAIGRITGFIQQHLKHMDAGNATVTSKLRKRVGAGLSSSLKTKTGSKLSASGSIKKMFNRQ